MCVMKMKKLTTFVACAAMAGVFATSAFAANDAQVARAQDYLNSKGIAYTVTASDVDKALAAGYTADSLVAKANELLDRAKSDPEGAKNEAVSTLNALGVSVSDAKVTVNGNDITLSVYRRLSLGDRRRGDCNRIRVFHYHDCGPVRVHEKKQSASFYEACLPLQSACKRRHKWLFGNGCRVSQRHCHADV